MKHHLICGIFVICCCNVYANTVKTDSLISMLEHQTNKEKINTLILLAHEYKNSNLPKSIDYLCQAYTLTNNIDSSQSANIEYELAYYYNRNGSIDSSDKYYSLALKHYTNQKDTLNIMKTSTMYGNIKKEMGDMVESANLNKNAIKLYYPFKNDHPDSKKINIMHLSTMMSNYALAIVPLGQYDSALYYLTKVYEIKESNNASEKNIAMGLVNIGYTYLLSEKFQKSITYHEQAVEIFNSISDSFNIQKCYNNIGLAYKKIGDTLLAMDYYNKSLTINRLINNERGIATSYINLSSIYKADNPDDIVALLEKANEISEKIKDKRYLSKGLINLSNVYYENKDYQQALGFAKKAFEYVKQTNELDVEVSLNLLLSNIYKNLSDYKNALVCHEKYSKLSDSLFNEENTQRFNLIQTQFETSKKEQEIASLRNEHEQEQLKNEILKYDRNITIVVALIIIIFTFLFAFLIIMKRRKDRTIHHQKELFFKKEKELAKSELEKSKIKEEELKQSVRYKSKQLSTHALHMMQKNMMLGEMYNKINLLNKLSETERKDKYNEILHQIRSSLSLDKDWDVFKLYFEEINKDFYTKLDKVTYHLTTHDHRLCALIKLNMSSKEMASVLNVAPNSIKSSRYRLKKKLGLDADADLEEYIRSL